jgi:DNA-directed RNA polymerase
MLRDEVGGEATNLVPMDKPQDIYQRVADVTIAKLKTMNNPLAAQWLNYGITRQTTKRSVMVVPYGGTLHACRAYIELHVVKRTADGVACPFENVRKATAFLAKLVWESIGEVVVKAKEAMLWLQQVARVMSKAQVPITWTTPAGFLAVQRYPTWEKRRIKMVFFGKMSKLQARYEGVEIEKDKQMTAISPNFVHSMDASALSFFVLRAPFRSFALVHDAYGTTAANVDQMNRLLREAFVQMYLDHDVLAEFRESCIKSLGTDEGIPPVPSAGVLDITKVIESAYFFA